jgi:integrase
MLLAIYGLRASEVSQMRLKDIDWEHEQITVRRVKSQKTHVYPLVPVVGEALIRYLKEGRPRCGYPEVFVKLKAPLGPVSRLSIHRLTNKQFLALEIKTLHRGPHSLRHACATHLIAEGFSFKEIGDHLGHSGTSATHIYAKVDLPHLREVADFDLGGLL